MRTEVETGGVWPGARNTWSSWRLEGVGGSSEPQKAGSPARHLEFEFSDSRTAGEVCVKRSTSHYAALSRNRLTWLWLSALSLPSGIHFLKLESGTGHLCYLRSWCQVTVLSWPDSD